MCLQVNRRRTIWPHRRAVTRGRLPARITSCTLRWICLWAMAGVHGRRRRAVIPMARPALEAHLTRRTPPFLTRRHHRSPPSRQDDQVKRCHHQESPRLATPHWQHLQITRGRACLVRSLRLGRTAPHRRRPLDLMRSRATPANRRRARNLGGQSSARYLQCLVEPLLIEWIHIFLRGQAPHRKRPREATPPDRRQPRHPLRSQETPPRMRHSCNHLIQGQTAPQHPRPSWQARGLHLACIRQQTTTLRMDARSPRYLLRRQMSTRHSRDLRGKHPREATPPSRSHPLANPRATASDKLYQHPSGKARYLLRCQTPPHGRRNILGARARCRVQIVVRQHVAH